MIDTDIYGKTLSNSFNEATTAVSQYIKPKVLINFLDSRHAFGKTVTTNDPHASESQGDTGYFFAPIQATNGTNRQGFTWAVADALDNNGKTIRADGTWYAMPSDREDNYEFGWWSGSKSTANTHSTYNGYEFSTNPTLDIEFNARKCNKIIVYTPEFYGQIDTYTIVVRSSDSGVPNPLYQETSRISDGEYFSVHYLPDSIGNEDVYKVELEIHTTKNPEDYARVQSVDILYQEDISDFVIDYNISKTRDLHESSLPIAGTDSGSLSITLDNSEKDFNIFGSSSTYGQYMRKDLRVFVSSGWQIEDHESQYVNKELRSALSNSDTTLSLINTDGLPEGGTDNYFVLEVDPLGVNKEYILCNTKTNTYDINIVQRGYANTKAKNHAIGTTVRFDTFEYPAYSEFFVDEWSSDTQSMTTTVTCMDWGKYLSEIVLSDGFFIEKSTLPEACEILVLKTNFPKADIESLRRFDTSAKNKGAILHFDFNESTVDRSGNEIKPEKGLRARFFAMPGDAISKVKDITADALDRELSQLEKALGETSFVSPDVSTNSVTISDLGSEVGYPYSIGDVGPGGGIIFITPSAIGGLGGDYYYECAPADVGQYQWGGYSALGTKILVGTTGTAIGDGPQNTIDIVADIGKATTYAARIADEYSLNGYDDWFLPSKDELNQIYVNKSHISGLNDNYWSSSEIDLSTVWAQAINTPNDGMQIIYTKSLAAGVRPVRRFIATVPITYALNLADQDLSNTGYSFTNIDGNTTSTYFNSVYDGFYVPTDTGEQYLSIEIAQGGVRVYLDDNLIINEWRLHPVSVGQYFTVESEAVYLTAGNPYKLRIESFHELGNFSIRLKKAVGISASEPVLDDEVYTIAAIDKIGSRDASYFSGQYGRNKQRNYALYLDNPEIGLSGGLPSNSENKYCTLSSNSYIRLPYHVSWDLNSNSSNNYNNGKWSFETYIKIPETYSGDGEYISTWSNSSPTSGFEFYSNSVSHGFKIITSSGTESVSSNVALSNSEFSHLIVTFDGSDLSYYVNGELKDTETLTGSISSWSNDDLTIGGRGASYSSGAEVVPSIFRNLSVDEFIMYPRALTLDQVADRYTESQMRELTIYPFLYGGEVSIREIIDEISLADLGRFYIDEENIARYEHYYAFWEPTIDRHANTQLTINDDDTILNANYLVQLQTNKVVIKVAGISSNLVGTQPLWRADDPTTLAVVNLEAGINTTSSSMYVDTTTDPPFSKAGYLVIDNEIIKYSNKSPNQFLDLERGQFGTTPASHTANTAVREARYWDLKYDKAPAFQVKNPFITGIAYEEPDEIVILKWVPDAYGAELLIAASNNVAKGSVVFAEGTNPLTEKVAFTSIAGTPVVLTEQNSQIKEQVAAIESCLCIYGVKELVIENRYITDFVHAQKMANFIIEKNALPVPILNLNTVPTPRIKVGDRIKISGLDAFDIINGEYWVVSRSYNYGDSISQSLILRQVS